MYLTLRPSGYRFQIAVPTHLHCELGRTPIRINLGRIPAPLAQKAARLLSDHSKTVFLSLRATRKGAKEMSREALSFSLAAIADELKEIELERTEATMNALAINRAEYPGFEKWQEQQQETKDERSAMDFWNEVRAAD